MPAPSSTLMRRVTGQEPVLWGTIIGFGAVPLPVRVRPRGRRRRGRASRRARPRPSSTCPTASARMRRRSARSAPTRRAGLPVPQEPRRRRPRSARGDRRGLVPQRHLGRLRQARPRRRLAAPERRVSGALQPLREVGVQALERHALLRHRVAVAHGDGAVVERVEVDRDAERRADLVLAAVAAADRAGVVEVDVPLAAQVCRRPRARSARASRCATAAARRP